MENPNQEKMLVRYPQLVTIENSKKIIEQMEKCICKIKNGKGTGFFCYIPSDNKKIPVLITAYHVIDENILEQNKTINISLNNDEKEINIKLNENRLIYMSRQYDVTIIELKPIDNFNDFLELDKDIFNEATNIKDESIYIIQYPKYGIEQRLAVSYGILKSITNYHIIHCSSTEEGSSGAPILKLSTNKIIGIHKASFKNFNSNKGTFLKFPISEFIKEKIKKSNIKETEIFSCIPRLDSQKDISYEFLKNKIDKTIIKIDKKTHENNLDCTKNYSSEFDDLRQFIDLDREHSNNINNEFTEKNRYYAIRPYNHNSIEINTPSKYINASPINIFGKKYIISTQGPLSNTIEDFWTMIDEYHCNVIIMLTKFEENASKKCENYLNTNNKMEKYEIEIISEEKKINININITKINLINKYHKEKKIITHYQYEGWPDYDIPINNQCYNTFEFLIKKSENLKGDYPVVIHCGGGVGRTGTFTAIYLLYKEIMEQIKDENVNIIKFSVFNLVRKIKEMRLYSVETEEQYKFIYDYINMILIKYEII